ncbi:MAG TPA: hypothetical protein DCE56_43955 [Cyanobacteria bacterium UBA8553]|nr:hypothetical protein [Cyanobacteria bacterium UBA8553]HAJ62549.1 hypothetical protein [Cyanobacteria bacterium UBA8543]
MNQCPCCSAQLLRHIRHNRIYWFCSRCRQDMPDLSFAIANLHQEFQIQNTKNPLFVQQLSKHC